MWCPKYEPTSTEARIFVNERVIEEHERRAETLRREIEFLRETDLTYREAISGGTVSEYRDGRHAVTEPRAEG